MGDAVKRKEGRVETAVEVSKGIIKEAAVQ
jgi:hypothetical protein